MLLAACAAPPTPGTFDTAARAVHPTLDDLWSGRAHFVVDTVKTGLPMGESDSVVLDDGRIFSYVHASTPSAGVVDQCGDPVAFPGCVVLFVSEDGGHTFVAKEEPKRCLFPCRQCPCDTRLDQIDQQQYPQTARTDDGSWRMVYEYRANVLVRSSRDGMAWSPPEEIPLTGIWADWLMACRVEERIGAHPHSEREYDCLVGSPPGIIFAPNELGEEGLFVFVGVGQNPGGMGCYVGSPDGPAALLRKCRHNPLFSGANDYGPVGNLGKLKNAKEDVNPYFDFRTISSADPLTVGPRTYMFYEGVRGPGPGDAGDTQFGLGLARTLTDQIDGPWETYPNNPILIDLPGNVGLGHADVIVFNGETLLYTSLDGKSRSRLSLQWVD